MKDEFVKKYFKDTAKEFDDIYDNKGGILKKCINKLLRKGMRERVALTLQICDNANCKTLLDIGCGSGRIALPLAEKGLKLVGIDYSSEMIDLANEYLKEYMEKGKSNLDVKFICGDFMKDFKNNELFDITLALGFFDYIENPLPVMKKMRDLTKEKMIASYPAKFTPQMPIRKIWLRKRKCPVYFYTKRKINDLYKSIDVEDYKIVKVAAGYLVTANLSKK